MLKLNVNKTKLCQLLDELGIMHPASKHMEFSKLCDVEWYFLICKNVEEPFRVCFGRVCGEICLQVNNITLKSSPLELLIDIGLVEVIGG